MHTTDITTQSNLVTAVVASNTDATTITLRWTDPEDTIDYTGLTISSATAVGSLGTSITVDADAGTARELAISSLTADTDYGCIDASNPTSTGTIVIPAVVASPGGPIPVTCGETLLPGQRP